MKELELRKQEECCAWVVCGREGQQKVHSLVEFSLLLFLNLDTLARCYA